MKTIKQPLYSTYLAAAEDILAILDDFNFQTDMRFDADDLKTRIVEAIQKKVEE
jgi:hypothetical protein